VYDIYVNLTASRSLLIDSETICITSCIGIQPVGDLIYIYFIYKYRFHKRGRNLLQAFSKCLHEVYFYLKRYSHVNERSALYLRIPSSNSKASHKHLTHRIPSSRSKTFHQPLIFSVSLFNISCLRVLSSNGKSHVEN
jgi:hypothetical protein